MAQISRLLFVAAIAGLAIWGFTRLTDNAYDPADHAGFSEEALAARITQINEARTMVDALNGNHPIFYAVLADRASETGLHDLAYELAEAAVEDLVDYDYNGASTAFYTCTRIARVSSRFGLASEILNACLDNAATLLPSSENEYGPWQWEYLHQELYYEVKKLELDEVALRIATFLHEVIIPVHIASQNDHVVQNDIGIVGQELGPEVATPHCQDMWDGFQETKTFGDTLEYMVGEGFDCFPLLDEVELIGIGDWVGETLQSLNGDEYDSENVASLINLVRFQSEMGRANMVVPQLPSETDCNGKGTRLCLVDHILGLRAGHDEHGNWHDDDWIWIDSLLLLSEGQGESIERAAQQLTTQSFEMNLREYVESHDAEAVADFRDQAEIDYIGHLAHGSPDQALALLRDRFPVTREQPRELRYIVYRIVRNYLQSGRDTDASRTLDEGLSLFPLPSSPTEEERIFIIHYYLESNPAVVAAIYHTAAGERNKALDALRYAGSETESMGGPIAVGQVLTMAGFTDEARTSFASAETMVQQDESFQSRWETEEPLSFYHTLVSVSLIVPIDPFESRLDRYPVLGLYGIPYFERGYGWHDDALIPY